MDAFPGRLQISPASGAVLILAPSKAFGAAYPQENVWRMAANMRRGAGAVRASAIKQMMARRDLQHIAAVAATLALAVGAIAVLLTM
jgi:hypothetical protein